MVCKIAEDGVEVWIVSGGFLHRTASVVGNDELGNPTEKLQGMAMSAHPASEVFPFEGLYIGGVASS